MNFYSETSINDTLSKLDKNTYLIMVCIENDKKKSKIIKEFARLGGQHHIIKGKSKYDVLVIEIEYGQFNEIYRAGVKSTKLSGMENPVTIIKAPNQSFTILINPEKTSTSVTDIDSDNFERGISELLDFDFRIDRVISPKIKNFRLQPV